MYMYDKSSKVV